MANNSIPATESRWGASNIVNERLQAQLKEIMLGSHEDRTSRGSNGQLVWDLYFSYVDVETRKKRGAQDLEPIFAEVDEVESMEELFAWLSRNLMLKAGPLVLEVLQDPVNASVNALWMSQSELGMPQSYYLKNDSETSSVQDQYMRHIESISTLVGQNWDAESIFQLEKSLAEIQLSPVEVRKAQLEAKKTSIEELQALAPSAPVIAYLENSGFNTTTVVPLGPEFFANLSNLISNTDLATWKELCKWQIAHQFSRDLSEELFGETFKFFGGVLQGQAENKPLTTRAARFVSENLPDPVGQEYVKRFFSAESKEYMENLVQDLLDSYRDRIRDVDWMSDTTKEKALEKLNAIDVKVGYPDVWEDFSGVKLSADNLFNNMIELLEYKKSKIIEKLSKPVDRKKWISPVQVVNAFYSPAQNSITFPAGILQPPFFDLCADDAMNFGAIGAVIGHEITHGFDSSGSNYGPTGNLENWWTPEDKERFHELTSRLVEQYSSYEVLPGVFVNGNLTLGENIADLGGVAVALQAYLKATPEEEANSVGEDGFTGLQRVLMAYGRIWEQLIRPEFAKLLKETDPHSPARFRVDGVMTNTPQFNTAFDCQDRGLPSKDPIIIW
jgi:putative endopeptidase